VALAYALSPGLEFLKSAGIVRKESVRLDPSELSGGIAFATLWVKSQLKAWQINEKIEPGQWSLLQQGENFFLPQGEITLGRTIEVTLSKALPCPGPLVSFDDILKFKEQRKDELQEFRFMMDDLYTSISSSPDIPHSMNSAKERIESALLNLNKVADESWNDKFSSTLKVNLSLKDIADGAIRGATLAPFLSLPVLPLALIGAAHASIKFEVKDKGKIAKITRGLSGLVYAHKVERGLK
jgi:hypothetical protein